MNGIERCVATIQGTPVDRRFVVLGLSLYGARLTGCPLARYYADPVAYVQGQQAVLETFGADLALAPFCVAAEGEAFGCTVKTFDNYPPTLARPAVTDPHDLGRLAMPDLNTHPRLSYLRESVRLLAASVGTQVPVAAIALGPLDLPVFLLGAEEWMEALLFRPDRLKAVLELTVPFFVQWANALFADGASLVLASTAYLNPYTITDKVAAEVAIPVMQQALAELKGPVVLFHSGIPIMRALPYCQGLPNVLGFFLDERDDIRQARACVGPDPMLLGGVSGPTLDQYAPDEVKRRCKAILRENAGDSRFALATPAADIPLSTPPETIRAIRQAVDEFAENPEDE